MTTSGIITLIIFTILRVNPTLCWDTDNLELYDLVEEVNENFYAVLGVSRDASNSEIKKAYRKKTLLLHPDKNEAVDAEDQFRKLVAVYEILKDEKKREKYNHVLDYGLPDWRQPVYYYRKARKLGLAELALVLCIIITIGQYFVLWAVYLERRLAMEDFFMSKKKKETKKKKCKAAALNEQLEEDLHETLQAIPKPNLRNLWPFTLTVWLVKTTVSLPSRVREAREQRRLLAEIRRLEEKERQRLEAQYRQEQELRKQKRKMKQEHKLPEFGDLPEVDGAPVLYDSQNLHDDNPVEESYKQALKTGEWMDEDFVMLSKAYIKFPGGTVNRWERIAEMVGRPVAEVTSKCKQMKGNFQMNLSSSVQAGTKNSKKQISISDEIISKPSPENVKETQVRKRNRNKTNKDVDRTLMISKGATNTSSDFGVEIKPENQTGLQVSSNRKPVQPKNNINQSANLNGNAGDKIVIKTKGGSQKDGTKVNSSEGLDVDSWTQNQQVILEWALKQYPKTVDQRWEKIAGHIPGKTKDDCIARFKYLAELVKLKKQQQQQQGIST